MSEHRIVVDEDRELHVLDERVGVWCPICRDATAVEYRVAVVSVATLLVLARLAQFVCSECHTSWPGKMDVAP